MSKLRGIVVGHAGLASALVDAVEAIAGKDSGLVAVSNRDCDRGQLEQRVVDAVGEGSAIVFVDMPSGSCSIAVMRRLGTMNNVRVVTGVNLAMLLEFVFNRDGDPESIAKLVAAAGVNAVAAR